jgi:lysine decarboxylase/arginine decarboxylase
MKGEDAKTKPHIRDLLVIIRSHNEKVPIFLMAGRSEASSIPTEVMQMANELVWVLEDTADFIAGRVTAEIIRYHDELLPPLLGKLLKFSRLHEYSWHTPGHTGGTAFLKSPVGRAFYDYFGENLFRSDLSISVEELGSLLSHSGPIGESENYAARIFGADRSYSVTNGTSTSNRIVFAATVTAREIALCDRNCHKSIEHGLTMTGAIPNYLIPSRNRYGIIGLIHPEHLTPEAIKRSISSNVLTKNCENQTPALAVVTNSTYDGLCYNVTRVIELLEKSVDRIHFDEAWYAYARFNPIYKERFAMHGDPTQYHGPTLFATQSTHKLLAALSQASFIHLREGRKPIDHDRFNEAFMMHSSTSPQYAIIASNEVSAAMMEGAAGRAITTESIKEAVAFRRMIGRIRKDLASRQEWFFSTWNAEEVKDPASGNRIPFEDAPEELLVNDSDCWVLHPADKWHGFEKLEDSYCMLDPIKVSIVTPGVSVNGALESRGIPATLVTSYLDQRGIIVEKTSNFTILFLFSLGVTRGKWGTLVNALLEFKHDYDNNTRLTDALPSLVKAYPKNYSSMGLHELADEMFTLMKKTGQTQLLEDAFSALPQPTMTPAEAYKHLVHNEVEQIPVDKMAGRVVATGVVPYPPGIPMLMPGENAGLDNGAHLNYLRALQSWDRQFPGFGHDIHGVENIDGTYFVYCIKNLD